MYKLLTLFALLYSSMLHALPSYQIDLVFFVPPHNTASTNERVSDTPLLPLSKNAIALKMSGTTSNGLYQLLPSSLSGLKNEYYLLSRKSQYKVLAHYSWRQPANNQSAVALPQQDAKGWIIHGTIQIKQSSYYVLNTDLQVLAPNNPDTSFSIKHKQRLKGNTLYYLDNEQLGMLIKIHTS